MFDFIKKLFGSKGSTEKTVRIASDARLITTELVLASFINILKELLEQGSFNKQYRCVSNFLTTEAPEVADLLSLDELIEIGPKELYEAKILPFAKKYTLLQCRSNNKVFDDWMHKAASYIYKPELSV